MYSITSERRIYDPVYVSLRMTHFCQQVKREKNMEAESFIQHVERDLEGTSLPLSVTADWLEDGNETTGNQFQQPDWQVAQRLEPLEPDLFY